MTARKQVAQRAAVSEQVLLLTVFALVAFGLVMVYSASSGLALTEYGNSLYFLERDVAYAAVGLGAMLVCARIDYRWIGRVAPLFLLASFCLLLLVTIAGVSSHGAQRWLPLPGGFTIQPSELAKVALCVYGASVLAGRRHAPRDWRECLAPIGFVTAVLCALVVSEKDLGSAIAMAMVASALLVVSGARGTAIARLAGIAGGLAMALIWAEPWRRGRLLAFLDPSSHPSAGGYQLMQAAIAFGSGGLTGVGLGQSVQKMEFLPEAHTDMILAIIGEELGLVGVACVVIAFALLAWAGFRIALRATDPFGKLLAGSLTALVTGQAAINFGGVLGVLPLTGVPVPLISFGGTSLIVTLAGLGLVLSVAAHGQAAAVRAVPEPAVARQRQRRRSQPRRAAGARG